MSTIRTCEFCGKPLSATTRSKGLCVSCYRLKIEKKPIPCSFCQKPYIPIRKSSKFCSLICFNDARIAKSRSAPEPTPVPGARWIPLTQGKYALVDDLSYDEVSQFNWCAVRVRPNSRGEVFYALRTDTPIYLHRYLANPSSTEEVDHKNGDSLDCRIDNLLVTDKSGNGQNRLVRVGKASGYKGVHVTSSDNWVVRFCFRGKESYGGTFADKEIAARKYDEIVRLHGAVNATYNFPRSGERSALTGEVQP